MSDASAAETIAATQTAAVRFEIMGLFARGFASSWLMLGMGKQVAMQSGGIWMYADAKGYARPAN